MQVDSVGGCSELKVVEDKDILARDVYDRKVTELWFMMQKFILSEHIRGLDPKTCQQLCTRRYMWVGKKLSIEKKTDYKARMGKVDSRYQSPDEADSACLGIELVRHRLGLVPNTPGTISKSTDSGWRKFFESKKLLDGPEGNDFSDLNTFDDLQENPRTWDDGFLHNDFEVEEN